jgi:hypothetical protein
MYCSVRTATCVSQQDPTSSSTRPSIILGWRKKNRRQATNRSPRQLKKNTRSRVRDQLRSADFSVVYSSGHSALLESPLPGIPARHFGIPVGAIRPAPHLQEAGGCPASGARFSSSVRLSPQASWVKVKAWETADLVVGGFTGAPPGPISLLLGAYDGDGALVYVGRTVPVATNAALRRVLNELSASSSFAEWPRPGPGRWESHRCEEWSPLRPALVCEVSFSRLDGHSCATRRAS